MMDAVDKSTIHPTQIMISRVKYYRRQQHADDDDDYDDDADGDNNAW